MSETPTSEKPVAAKPAATKRRKNKVSLSTIGLVIVIAVLATTTVVFYQKYDHLKNNPQVAAQDQTNALISKVDQLLQLPSNETPTIATVQDPNKLKDQKFFANVKTGDKILIYSGARKAIVYRPSDNKIINVGPIDINSSKPTQN